MTVTNRPPTAADFARLSDEVAELQARFDALRDALREGLVTKSVVAERIAVSAPPSDGPGVFLEASPTDASVTLVSTDSDGGASAHLAVDHNGASLSFARDGLVRATIAAAEADQS